MIYRSKKDAWLMVLLALSLITPFVVGLLLILSVKTTPVGWCVLLIGVVAVGLVFCFALPVGYEVTAAEIIISSGLSRKKIALSSVEQIYETGNPLGAPALSLDRLRIDYRRDRESKFELISPEDKRGFLREVAERDDRLVMREMRVERVEQSQSPMASVF